MNGPEVEEPISIVCNKNSCNLWQPCLRYKLLSLLKLRKQSQFEFGTKSTRFRENNVRRASKKYPDKRRHFFFIRCLVLLKAGGTPTRFLWRVTRTVPSWCTRCPKQTCPWGALFVHESMRTTPRAATRPHRFQNVNHRPRAFHFVIYNIVSLNFFL